MNTTSVITSSLGNGLNWFSEQEVAWDNFHYITISYVVPVCCLVGFVENLAILAALYRMKTGLGESVRVYYAMLAVFNFFYLLTQHLLNAWFTAGLKFATQGKFYFSFTNENEWVCKVVKTYYTPFAVLVMWTYVLLNIERVFAIRFPLRAKSIFTIRRTLTYVAIIGIIGVLLWIYFMSITTIVYTPMLIGPINCIADSPSLVNLIFYDVLFNVAIFTLPPALSLVLGLMLLYFLKRQESVRSKLLVAHSSDRASSGATAGGVVVILMALFHALINLPPGAFGCFFLMCACSMLILYSHIFVISWVLCNVLVIITLQYSTLLFVFLLNIPLLYEHTTDAELVCSRWPAAGGDLMMIPKFFILYIFTMTLTAFSPLVDFWIYTFRIKQFRDMLMCSSSGRISSK